MKIALVFPKWTEEFGIFSHFSKSSSPHSPVNLTIIAALAEKEGHKVIIIDSEIENLSIQKTIERLKDFNPDIVGTTSTTPFFHIVKSFVEEVKKEMPDKITVLGGHHITVLKEETFSSCFDYAFIGEADVSWVQFLRCISKGESVESIKGILYRKDGKVISTGPPDPITDLDSLPIPARHLLKMNLYKMGTPTGKKCCSFIMAGRGCPFHCIYCSTDVFGRKLRKRSPKLIVEEIKMVAQQGIKYFLILDDTFTVDRRHVLEICSLLKKENLNIEFEINTRANLVDEELIKVMKEVGLARIFLGLETVDENIRKTIKKDVPLESYKKANLLAKKYKIEACNCCMFGLPGETEETIKKTLNYLTNAKEIIHSNINIAVPYPGTELCEMAKRREYDITLLTDDYTKYKRFNNSVMKVGNLTPQRLIELQNWAYIRTFFLPWRIIPAIKKYGFMSIILVLVRLYRHIRNKFKKQI